MLNSRATSPSRVFAYPVGILLFNRPEYAEKVLASLAAQTVPIDSDQLTIIRDGYQGSRDESLGRPDRTAEVDRLAREYFPDAQHVSHDSNIGIARAFDELERHVFRNPRNPWGAFFEEDFLVDADYLDVMTRLITLADPRPEIVQVNATGDVQCELSRGEKSLYPAAHSWAFALRRTHWSERASIVSDYLRVVGDAPYWLRDDRRVLMTMAHRGIQLAGTSQDAVKTAAVLAHGRASIVTGVAHGEYIGRIGEHFVESSFERLGFEDKRRARPRATLPAAISDTFARDLVKETVVYRTEQAVNIMLDDKEHLSSSLEHAERISDDLRQQITHIRSSLSWRLAAPVRWLGRIRPSRGGTSHSSTKQGEG